MKFLLKFTDWIVRMIDLASQDQRSSMNEEALAEWAKERRDYFAVTRKFRERKK